MIRLPLLFRRSTPLEVAARELAQSVLQRLAHQNAIDYSTALLSYHDARIARLRSLLANHANVSSLPSLDLSGLAPNASTPPTGPTNRKIYQS